MNTNLLFGLSKICHRIVTASRLKPYTMCTISTGRPELDKKINEWLKWDRNETTSAELMRMVDDKKFDELSKILMNRLSFGTAGLRGKMAVGYACMNDLVIIQTGQGIAKYLEKTEKRERLKNRGIVIGYDGRHNSKRWAELTASIFLNAGYLVNLYGSPVPTPFIPFYLKKRGCAFGVMITASHNPKEDNGYKAYGPNGAQILSPVDTLIQESILQNLEPLDSSWDTIKSDFCSRYFDYPLKYALNWYLEYIDEMIRPEYRELNASMNLLFTYTAMHGVGYKYVKEVFEYVSLRFVSVPEQTDPDPEFPTVKFPNPEEGKSSLDLSFKTADKHDSVIILANDPDADRLAAAEKNKKTGVWKVFTGNELGALFGWWTLHCYKKLVPGIPLCNIYMISSTVSSMILKTMSRAEDFHFIETLTGFKWIANEALKLDKCETALFCFEEAIGYMFSTDVPDKDGVLAACQLATMASYVYSKGQTLAGQLEDIYSKYGQHVSSNSYYICHEPDTIKRIFERIRNFDGENTYPSGILNNKYQIKSVRDLTTGYDNSQPDNKAILPVSSKSQMITFYFTNGLVCTLRTSGTEPKIKYYTELCASPKIKDKEQILSTLHEMVGAICEEFLQPEENNLIAKSD